MFIDSIVAGLMVLALWKGWRKGLVLALFSFLALVLGLAAAVKLSAVAAAYLGEHTNLSERWLPFAAFALVFIGVALLVRLGAKMIESGLEAVALGWANRLGGVLFFALLYLFVLSLLLFYASQLNLIKPETLAASTTYPLLQPLGPRIVGLLGMVLPFFKNMFTELEGFFEP
ncbi:CvpA family protein [Paracnuella aquatica]|uniref:CvpA family protein n=1 Tax=Paracnuella aquatica TaxID=2268757 RepID=UPI000DEF2477|nr:CvpA family protein [Paracnuella aquatica]RPD46021.1 CvpA family protein [Paracnuella aquatica]